MGLIGELFALAGLKIDSGSFAAYSAELKGAESKISDFSSTSSGLMAGAFAVPAMATAGIAAVGLEMASGFQDAGVSLTNLYGDAETAKEKFQWMTEFAATTPFEFTEIEEGAIKLKAYGMDIQTYGKTFGDTAAGMGKSLDQVIEAVADAQTGEFERMKELGIKAVQVQKSNLDQYAQYGASVGDTMLVYADSNGKQMAQAVDRNNREMVTSTIAAIWNEKYEGAMEVRSKTLSGLGSTIKDNLTFALTDLIGYDMKNMEVETVSLLGVMNNLAGVAITLTGGLSKISEPMQMFIQVAALGVSAIGLLAAGFIGYSAILPLVTGSTAIFGVTLSAAIWPVTASVLILASLAAGLVYLDEKTGIVTASWQFMSDIFTIVVDRISTAVTTLKNFIVDQITIIQTIFSNIFPLEVVNKIEGIIGGISDKFGNMANKYHDDAEAIRSDNTEVATSAEKPAKATDMLGLSFLNSGKQATVAGTSYTNSGVAANAAGVGFNNAASGLANTNTQAKAAKGGLDSVTQAALNAVNATKQLWSAQSQIASQAMTIRQAEKTVSEGWSSSGGKGSTSSEGVTVVAASSSSKSGAGLGSMSGYNTLSGGTTYNIGTINNNGESINSTKTTMAVHGVA